jgi:hypothetical protein
LRRYAQAALVLQPQQPAGGVQAGSLGNRGKRRERDADSDDDDYGSTQ